MEEKTTQVQVTKGHIVKGMSSGHVFWETPSMARMFAEAGAVAIVGNLPGPSTVKPAGPSEIKAPSTAATPGPSSDSPESPATGKGSRSSSSEEAPPSPRSKLKKSKKLTKRGK